MKRSDLEHDGLGPDNAETLMQQHVEAAGPKKKKPKPDRRKDLAAAPAPPKPRTVCKYYMEGLCTKGAACTFSHDVKPRKTLEEAKVKEVCKYFMMGSCLKGEQCIFSHDLKRKPCKFYHLWNSCAAGRDCRFSHDPIDQEAYARLTE